MFLNPFDLLFFMNLGTLFSAFSRLVSCSVRFLTPTILPEGALLGLLNFWYKVNLLYKMAQGVLDPTTHLIFRECRGLLGFLAIFLTFSVLVLYVTFLGKPSKLQQKFPTSTVVNFSQVLPCSSFEGFP